MNFQIELLRGFFLVNLSVNLSVILANCSHLDNIHSSKTLNTIGHHVPNILVLNQLIYEQSVSRTAHPPLKTYHSHSLSRKLSKNPSFLYSIAACQQKIYP